MQLLIAKQIESGRWEKAAILKTTAAGRLTNIPARLCGQIEVGIGKMAAAYFHGGNRRTHDPLLAALRRLSC